MMRSYLRSSISTKLLPMLLAVIALLLALNLVVLALRSTTSTAEEPTNPEVLSNFPLPGSLSLCHEPIPLENRKNLDMLDREFTIAVWDRAQVFMWLKRAGRYFPYIEEKLAEAGVPGDLKYVAVAESALITDIKSSKRAVGLWQFLSRTARRYGLRKNRLIDERLDFERSTEAAIRYLKRLHSEFGNWTLALAAYNCGDAFLKSEIRRQKVKDFYRLDLPLETERYIFRIAAIKIIMENPKHFGFHLPAEHIYPPRWYDRVEVEINQRLKFTDLALALDTDFKTLKELNPQFLRDYVPRGEYKIKVPPGFGPKVVVALQKLGKGGDRQREYISENHYVVREGDTLGRIARRTGVSLATLQRINGIEGSTIWAGQKLRLTH
ncbi:MAG: transglycosylase SLT domain-containing protein [Deltaproteobacteria bacterium]|nr:MAG: transglycosylase SLT domain-containing protein [Deltaproteobacteria bacterium]